MTRARCVFLRCPRRNIWREDEINDEKRYKAGQPMNSIDSGPIGSQVKLLKRFSLEFRRCVEEEGI
jgi:hypothetical protein